MPSIRRSLTTDESDDDFRRATNKKRNNRKQKLIGADPHSISDVPSADSVNATTAVPAINENIRDSTGVGGANQENFVPTVTYFK